MKRRSWTKRSLTMSFACLCLTVLSGCALWPSAGSNGLLYTNVTRPVTVLSPDAAAVRIGEACAVGFLGLFASGNSSINVAKSRAGITDITSVEERFQQILFGVYSKYCVVVSGT